MRRRLSLLALTLALAAAAVPSAVALPAEGDDTMGGSGDAGDSDTGNTDPIKVTSDLIDQTTDSMIVANTNLATGAADAAQAVGGTEGLQDAAASLIQNGAVPKPVTPTTLSAAAATAADADLAQMLKELITSTGAPEELLKKVEGFAIKLDANGCYDIEGPNELALKLCEDDAGARQPILSKVADAPALSWVNGTITNTGEGALCKFAFASPTTDLVNDAVKVVPSTLPVALPNVAPKATIDLAPGEELPFAFLLPFDVKTGTPGFVGFADTLATCPAAVKKLGPPEKIPDAEMAGAAAEAAAAVTTDAAAAAVAEVTEGAGVAMDAVNKVAAAAAAEGAGVQTMDHADHEHAEEGVEVQQATSAAGARSVSVAAGLAAAGATVLAFVLA